MNKFHSLLLVIVIIGNNCQAYPSLEDKEYERVPIPAPDKCPDNELLYPGNQIHDDWTCDCVSGYIYYPPVDACFGAYRQGPCPQTYHLILKPDKVVSECVVNPCEEGFASYEGVCYELDKPDGPCAPAEFGGGIFGVNATTLTVECLKEPQKLSLRFYIPPNCPSGSRRDTSNTCREDWNVYPDNRTQW